MPVGTSVVTIGNFDGCHRGHAALIEHSRQLAASSGGRVVVMSFDPHPASVLRPGQAPAKLTTWDRRTTLLRSLGADEVVRLDPADGLLSLEPVDFIEQRVMPKRPTHMVEGPDFRFGKGRAGDLEVLRVLGEGLGFEVVEIGAVTGATTDHLEVPVSSTLIRGLIRDGRVRDAAAFLGRPHRVVGEVVRGDRLGRTIGFPTANVRADVLLPGSGVYAGVAHLPGGERLPAAINMGTRPTVNGMDERFEVHMLDAQGDESPLAGLDEYGWRIGVDLVARIRDQVRFESLEALSAQLERDCDRVRDVIRRSMVGGASV